ncbi:[Fe-Fe] hydrogenase large subunit C-terminal domain-containing protein [Breznakiellaceae bacterium SP9]
MIYNHDEDCISCYNCLRHCPVKAIKVENKKTETLNELCVLCGECVQQCTRKIKYYQNDINKVTELFTQKKRVFASLSPAFIAEWKDCSIEQIIAALKQLGFYAVSETALGADLVSQRIAQILEQASIENAKKPFISSVCPSVVKYIKLYRRKFAACIIDLPSPLLAHARLLKQLYGQDISVVGIGSCIAGKMEAEQFEEIDAVLTFKELRTWMQRKAFMPHEIKAAGNDLQFVPYKAAKGSLYAIENDGIIAAYKNYAPLPHTISIAGSGFENIRKLLRGFDLETFQGPAFFSLLACSGGCINGPGLSDNSPSAAHRILRLLRYVQDASDKARDEILTQPIQMTGSLNFPVLETRSHTEDEIRLALERIGKYSKLDMVNCGNCGYNSCRDFCIALLENRAKRSMCGVYMHSLTAKQADGLLDAIPSGVVIVDKDLKIIQCNKNFASLFGRDMEELFEMVPGLAGADLEKITEAVEYFRMFFMFDDAEHSEFDFAENNKIYHLNMFMIEKDESAAAVIDDITIPQIQKNKVIANAKNIIDKNISVVQQIAFLLGEHAAETESILQSLIETFSVNGEQNE